METPFGFEKILNELSREAGYTETQPGIYKFNEKLLTREGVLAAGAPKASFFSNKAFERWHRTSEKRNRYPHTE